MKSKDDNDDDKAAEKEPFSKLGLASGPCLIFGFSNLFHFFFTSTFLSLALYIYILHHQKKIKDIYFLYISLLNTIMFC
jgi:hypothetical protein